MIGRTLCLVGLVLVPFASINAAGCSSDEPTADADAGADGDTDAAVGTWSCGPDKTTSNPYDSRLECEGGRDGDPSCYPPTPTGKCAKDERAYVCGGCASTISGGKTVFVFELEPCTCVF